MRTSGSARKCGVEVKIETRIENQIFLLDDGRVNFMVAFGMDTVRAVAIVQHLGQFAELTEPL